MLWPMWKGRPAAAAAAGIELRWVEQWDEEGAEKSMSVCSDSGRVRGRGVCVWTSGIGWRWEGREAPRRCRV